MKKVRNYHLDAENSADLSESLLRIINAIDGLMNTGKVWSNLTKNAANILHVLKELELLMEQQWVDLSYILRAQKLPQKMPKINLADTIK